MGHAKKQIQPNPLPILTYIKNGNERYPQKTFFSGGTFTKLTLRFSLFTFDLSMGHPMGHLKNKIRPKPLPKLSHAKQNHMFYQQKIISS